VRINKSLSDTNTYMLMSSWSAAAACWQARLVLAEPEQQHKEAEGQDAAEDEAEEETPKPKRKEPKLPPK
jgi:hypothetical protein